MKRTWKTWFIVALAAALALIPVATALAAYSGGGGHYP